MLKEAILNAIEDSIGKDEKFVMPTPVARSAKEVEQFLADFTASFPNLESDPDLAPLSAEYTSF